MRANRWLGVLIIIAGMAVYLEASRYQAKVSTDPVGPAAYPQGLGIVAVILGLYLLAEGWGMSLGQRRAAREAAAAGGDSGSGEDAPMRLSGADWRALLGVVAPAAAYMLVLEYAGFLLSTLLLVGTLMWVAGERRWPVVAATGAIVSASLYLIFGRLFRVLLPGGFLGF